MDKKSMLITGVVIAFAAIAIVIIFTTKKNDDLARTASTTTNDSSASNNSNTNLGKKDACDYLTADAATTLLGQSATKGDSPASDSSEDVSVTTCTYMEQAGESIASIQAARSATVLLRAPLTDAGVTSNHQPFDSRKEGTEAVAGYGQDAYWDPEMGQLNVLTKDAWFIMSYGKMRASDRTLEQTKQLANQIIPNY